MKDIKFTLKAIAEAPQGQKSLWRRAAKSLWSAYLALPLATAVALYGFFSVVCKMIVPAIELHAQTSKWKTAINLLNIDFIGLVLFLLGFAVALYTSWRAHHVMLRFVGQFPRRELSSNRRNLLLAETTTIVFLVLWVGVLPIIALFLSGVAASHSSLGASSVAPPAWVVLSLLLFTLVFFLALEITLTFTRLTFRELPVTHNDPQLGQDPQTIPAPAAEATIPTLPTDLNLNTPTTMKLLPLVTLAFLTSVSASASQPLRRAVQRTLADGTTVTVERRGGPEMSWWETSDGQRFTDTEARVLVPFTFADEQRLQQVSRAGYAPFTAMPQGSSRNGQHRSMVASTPDGLGQYGHSGMGVVKSIGSPTIPVIMMAFSDLDFLPENDKNKIDRFLNEEGYHDEPYAVGSVYDYFNLSSHGHFKPHFEVVAKVILPNGYKYYGAKSGSANDARRAEAIREAVRLAEEQGVDLSRYSTNGRSPLISVIHAGPGEQEDFGKDYNDYFWAHFSQTTVSAKSTIFDSYLLTNETMRNFDNAGNVISQNMTGIGTFCHELGHALGLPDMYDVNGSTNGTGNTPGYWDIMDYQFMYDGYRPMEYNAYERSMMGWIQIADITPSAHGICTLAPLGAATTGENEVFRIVNPDNANEYFILENRQKTTFYMDNMLGTGMLVWRINYDSNLWSGNRVNIDSKNQRVSVVPADGAWQSNQDLNLRDANNKRYTFAGDLFPGYAQVTTFNSNFGTFETGSFQGSLTEIAVDATSRRVTFNYSDPTIITSTPVLDTANAAHTYDLQGRRTSALQHPTGLYINSGRVVITK